MFVVGLDDLLGSAGGASYVVAGLPATAANEPPLGTYRTSAALPLVQGFADRAAAFLEHQESGEAFRRSRLVSRVLARRRLGAEVAGHQTGLSNTAYLAAASGTQKIVVKITPARVKFTISDPLSGVGVYLGGVRGVEPNSKSPPGRRGVVREFSDGARDRLADRAAELQAMGKVPDVMLTLTSPANWEEIYLYDPETGEVLEGGRLFKQHLDTFRKRLDRFLQKLGVHHWGALWFLEFQERGAPHVHLILFDCKLSGDQRRTVRSWLGRAWSSVVGNPSKFEKAKHAKAGTQVARMKKQHFGYAQKYASKMAQKCVPDGFGGVGRFWGVWNCKKSSSVMLELDYSRFDQQQRDFVHHLALVVLGTVYPHSPDFFSTRIKRVWDALEQGIRHKQGFSVYGAAASETALSVFA